MNVTQASSGLPNGSTPETNVREADSQRFQGQLSLAQQEIEWFTSNDGQQAKQSAPEEQTGDKRDREDREKERIVDAASTDFSEQNRLDDTIANAASTDFSEQNRLDDTIVNAASMAFSEQIRLENTIEEAISLENHENRHRTRGLTQENVREMSKNEFETFKESVNSEIIENRVRGQKGRLPMPAVQSSDEIEGVAAEFSEVLGNVGEEKGKRTSAGSEGLNPNRDIENTSQQRRNHSAIPNDILRSMVQQRNDTGVSQGANTRTSQLSFSSQGRDPSSNLNQGTRSHNPTSAKTSAKTSSSKGFSLPNIDSSSAFETQRTDPGSRINRAHSNRNEQANIREVIGNVKVMLATRKDELLMKLNPEHLGRLEIRLKRDGGRLTGRFRVESQQAREILESQLPHLRQGLEEQGIFIEDFQFLVSDDGSSASNSAFKDGQAQQHQSSGLASGKAVSSQTQDQTVDSDKIENSEADTGVGVSIFA